MSKSIQYVRSSQWITWPLTYLRLILPCIFFYFLSQIQISLLTISQRLYVHPFFLLNSNPLLPLVLWIYVCLHLQNFIAFSFYWFLSLMHTSISTNLKNLWTYDFLKYCIIISGKKKILKSLAYITGLIFSPLTESLPIAAWLPPSSRYSICCLEDFRGKNKK